MEESEIVTIWHLIKEVDKSEKMCATSKLVDPTKILNVKSHYEPLTQACATEISCMYSPGQK